MGSRKFERERQAFQARAQRGYRRRIGWSEHEVRLNGLSTLNEQSDGWIGQQVCECDADPRITATE